MVNLGYLHLPSDARLAALACLDTPMPVSSPEQLRAVGSKLALTAFVLRSALTELAGIDVSSLTWDGDAARRFAEAVHALGKLRVSEVPDRYDRFAQVLYRYASILDEISLALPSARAAVEEAYDALLAAQPAVYLWDVSNAAKAANLEGDCARTAARFAAYYNEWVEAVNTCAKALHVVDNHDHLHNPHGVHAFVQAVSKSAGELSQVFGEVGLGLALIVPPVGEALLAVSAVASGIALASDVARIDWADSVTRGDLAMDALGVVPPARMARAVLTDFGEGVRAVAKSQARQLRDSIDVVTPARRVVRDGPRGAATDVVAPLGELRSNADAVVGEAVTQAREAWNDRHDTVAGRLTNPIRFVIGPYRRLAKSVTS